VLLRHTYSTLGATWRYNALSLQCSIEQIQPDQSGERTLLTARKCWWHAVRTQLSGNKTKQNKTKQNKTKQNKTKQNTTKQNKREQNKTKQLNEQVNE